MASSDMNERCVVVLVRPEHPENIGLAARAMKNTGFAELRLAGIRRLSPQAFKTAVHAEDILERARLCADLDEATDDLQFIAAATAKPRKIGACATLDETAARVAALPPGTRVGLLFGNERTGLTAEELRRANLVFSIPQATRQPSYNLGAAVLITLYALFTVQGSPGAIKSPPGRSPRPKPGGGRDPLLSRREQDEVIDRILEKLAAGGFIHPTNKAHVTAWVHDFFGRAAMTGRDRGFLLAMFEKGVGRRTGTGPVPPDGPHPPTGSEESPSKKRPSNEKSGEQP